MKTWEQPALLDGARPTWSKHIYCATCGLRYAKLTPKDQSAGGVMAKVQREHRAANNCPAGHADMVALRCSLCPGMWILPVVTTGVREGDIYDQVIHPHERRVHGMDRRRHRHEGHDWFPGEDE